MSQSIREKANEMGVTCSTLQNLEIRKRFESENLRAMQWRL